MRKLKHDEFRPSFQDSIDVTDRVIKHLHSLHMKNELPFKFMKISHPASVCINYVPVVAMTFILDTKINGIASGTGDNDDIMNELNDYAKHCESQSGGECILYIYQVYVHEDVYYLRGGGKIYWPYKEKRIFKIDVSPAL